LSSIIHKRADDAHFPPLVLLLLLLELLELLASLLHRALGTVSNLSAATATATSKAAAIAAAAAGLLMAWHGEIPPHKNLRGLKATHNKFDRRHID